jgi:hypothetical protein
LIVLFPPQGPPTPTKSGGDLGAPPVSRRSHQLWISTIRPGL